MRIPALLRPDYERFDGVRPVNIYLLRLLFLLVFIFVGYDSWSTILGHDGAWDHVRAAAFCMWGAYSLLSLIGVLYPLKMLPLVLFEIVYKAVWLVIVAYPLWIANELVGSPAEEMTAAFLWVVLPILAMPWAYFFKAYILDRSTGGVHPVGVAVP
jgi:hypothetical protein